MTVSKFFRFTDEAGNSVYGEVPPKTPSQEWVGSEVTVLKGDPYTSLTKTDTKAKVQKVFHYTHDGAEMLSLKLIHV